MNHITAAGRAVMLAALATLAIAGVHTVDAQEVVMRPEGRGIEVVGVGEVEASPDEATLNFAMETSAATSREAAQQNAQQMERVIAALVAAGIPRDEIETRNFSVYPDYASGERGENPRVTGYRVNNQVTLKTTRLDAVGSLIDAALGAGANRVDGISFGLSNPQAAEAEALADAVRRARASAGAIAEALGVPLGPVLWASTSSDPVRPVMMMSARMESADMAQGYATPIQPGEQTVRARVTLMFAIGN